MEISLMSKHISLMTGLVVTSATILAAPVAQAQVYLGGEGGWTGLEGTKSRISGTTPAGTSFSFPINQSFNSGFNAGARVGYQWGPWRFEEEYSFRENGSNATALGPG